EAVFHTSVAGCSVLLNVLLLCATFLPTPKAFHSYLFLMRMQALADLTASALILTTMHRTVPCEWSLLFIAFGPCTLLGGTACYSFYSERTLSRCVFIKANKSEVDAQFTNVLICMGARYWILRCGPISRKRLMAAFAVFVALPAVFVTLMALFIRSDDSVAEQRLHWHFDYSTEYLVVTG
ncbi:hypothetical protein PENTCL1PPCAC_13933, partial [Pristionchus entomophagus]